MKRSLFLAATLLIMSALVAASSTTEADGCASWRIDSVGTSCPLQSETANACFYYNDYDYCICPLCNAKLTW
jgi:hypothetical protein